MGEFILVTGGARSGKSAFAVNLAKERGGRTAFIATCVPRDPEMEERVRLHQQNRPREWETHVEEKNVILILERIEGRADLAIVDCVTLLVSNCLLAEENEMTVLGRIRLLCDRIAESSLSAIIVSNEVGMGLVPRSDLGRRFRDVAGRANQILAERASEVYLLVAGIPWKLKGRTG